MRRKIIHAISLLTILNFAPIFSFAQDMETLQKGDSLHKGYRFSEAGSIYNSILSKSGDSLLNLSLQEKILQCENGKSLLQFAVTPNVVTKKVFPANDFYLHVAELPEKCWVPIPNQLVTNEPHKYYNAIYFPQGAEEIYFSAQDNSGSWNIYYTEMITDTLWSTPKIAGENITSPGDEIFPMLSADGNELYFASNGHYGMGGYDLYVSRWDEDGQEWGVPENLGFPYSSTSDDIFYINSPEGLFSVLATDRDCENGKIAIVPLEFIATPIKKELDNIEDIVKIAKLDPAPKEDPKEQKESTDEESEDEGMSKYSRLVANMRVLSAKLDSNLYKQEENRSLFDRLTNEDDRGYLKQVITSLENEAIGIRADLQRATAAVQEAEMDFLAQGIIPQIEIQESEEVEEEKVVLEYKFAKNQTRKLDEMNIEVPEPEFDYSFKILPEAQIVEDNTLPERLVYQIQIFVTSKPASLKSLKGLSPVFERKQPSGKYLYTVGLFSTHSEALSCLNQVRKRGFPKAYIVAYDKGKSVSIKNARILERQKAAQQAAVPYQLLLKSYPDGIPSGILTAIQGACDKDLAKSVMDGQTVYIVGPFSNKEDAEKLKEILFGLGVEGLSVEPIK